MLSTLPMAPSSPHLPAFSFDFSSAYKPSVSSPLSSSPIRASHTSPPLSPINPNAVSRPCFQHDFHSSPIQSAQPPKFKFAARDVKKNPLRQGREAAQENRRQLFLRNVKQRADDRAWERRGGDQEVSLAMSPPLQQKTWEDRIANKVTLGPKARVGCAQPSAETAERRGNQRPRV